MVRLELASKPECGILVRSVLAALGSELGWEPELLDDLKTAVTEACNNAVVHAYRDQGGRVVVRLDADEPWIEVIVCDQGQGLRGVSISEDHLRIGLPVISSLADRVEFLSPPQGGTEVRMSFSRDSAARKQAQSAQLDPHVPAGEARRGPDTESLHEITRSWTGHAIAELVGEGSLADGDVALVISPGELVGPALGRLVRALAAVHHFSLNRFAGLRDLTDRLAEGAADGPGHPRVAFSLTGTRRRLELAAGPFSAGTGGKLADLSAEAGLRELVDEVSVREGQHGEILELVLADTRSGSSL